MKSIKITQKSITESYEGLVLRAKLDIDFILLTIFSTTICFFGFRMNSPSIIIGAMVVSPLLYAVVATGTASFKRDWQSLLRGLKTLFIGFLIIIAITTFSNLLLPVSPQSEMISRINGAPLDYFFVAFFSGLAGTFALFWPEIIEAIAGIAISVALVPPAVLVGIGLENLDAHLFGVSSMIFLINLLGIYLGAFFMFVGLLFLSRHR